MFTYKIRVRKNGKSYKVFTYTNLSGRQVMDEIPFIRIRYPESKGFTIEVE